MKWGSPRYEKWGSPRYVWCASAPGRGRAGADTLELERAWHPLLWAWETRPRIATEVASATSTLSHFYDSYKEIYLVYCFIVTSLLVLTWNNTPQFYDISYSLDWLLTLKKKNQCIFQWSSFATVLFFHTTNMYWVPTYCVSDTILGLVSKFGIFLFSWRLYLAMGFQSVKKIYICKKSFGEWWHHWNEFVVRVQFKVNSECLGIKTVVSLLKIFYIILKFYLSITTYTHTC